MKPGPTALSGPGAVPVTHFGSLQQATACSSLLMLMISAGIFIVAAKRTPFGKMGGRLRDIHPSDLMAAAAKDAFKAGNVAPALVDTVNIGQVNTVIKNILSIY